MRSLMDNGTMFMVWMGIIVGVPLALTAFLMLFQPPKR